MASNEAGGIGVKLQAEGFGAFEKRMEAAAQSMEGTAQSAEQAAGELQGLGKPAQKAGKDFAKAAGGVEKLSGELQALGAKSNGASALERIQKRYERLQKTLTRGVELGSTSGTQTAQREVQALESALDEIARTHKIDVDASGVREIQQQLNQMRSQAGAQALGRLKEEYADLQTTLGRGLELGGIDEVEAMQKEAQFLKSALEEVAETHEINVDAGGLGEAAARLDHLEQQIESAGHAGQQTSGVVEGMTEDYKSLQQTVGRGLEMGTLDNADRLQKEIQYLEGALDEVARNHEISIEADGVQALNTRLNRLRQEAEEAGIAVGRAGGHVRGVNNTLFAFSDLAEDSAYGIRGMANNVPFLAESFGQLSQKTGGAGNALKALLGNLMSTGGLVAALGVASSVAVTFGDDIVAAMTGGSKEAAALKKEIKEVGGEILKVRSRLSNLSATLSTSTAEAILPELEEQISGLKEMKEILGGLRFADANPFSGRSGASFSQANLSDLDEALPQIDVSDFFSRVSVQNGSDFFKATQEDADTLLMLLEEAGITTEEITSETAALQAEYDSVEKQLRRNEARQKAINAAIDTGKVEASDFVSEISEAEDPFAFAQKSYEGFQSKLASRLDAKGLDEAERKAQSAGERIGFLEGAVDELVEAGVSKQAMAPFTNELTRLRAESEKLAARSGGGGSLGAVASAMQTLGEASEEISLRKYLGDLNALGAERARVDALKTAFMEVAGELGRNSDEAQRLLQKIRDTETAAMDAAAAMGMMRTPEPAGPVELNENREANPLGISLVGDPKAEIDKFMKAMQSGGENAANQLGQSLGNSLASGFQQAFQTLANGIGKNLAGLFGGFGEEKAQIKQQIAEVETELAKEVRKGSEQSIQRVRSLRDELSSLKGDLGEMEPSLGKLGKDLLGVFGDTLVQLGSALSAFGAAGLLFQTNGSFASFFQNPAAALAAGGIALSAGAAIKAAVASGNRAAGAGGGGRGDFGGYQRREGDGQGGAQSGVREMAKAQRETNKRLVEGQKQTNERLRAVETATREEKAVTEAEARNQQRRANRASQRRDPKTA